MSYLIFKKDSDKIRHLQDKRNRFIIVDKQTDCKKANEQIERSSFLKIGNDPTTGVKGAPNRCTKLLLAC